MGQTATGVLKKNNTDQRDSCCQMATTARKSLEENLGFPLWGRKCRSGYRVFSDCVGLGARKGAPLWSFWANCVVFAVLLCFVNTATAQGPQVLGYSFEEVPPVALPASQNLASTIAQHAITNEDAHSGEKCERFLFHSPTQQVEESRIVIPLPQARTFNELTASLWVRSNIPGVRIGVRLRFPHQIDPRTGAPLELDFFGSSYTDVRNWQQLTCQTSDELMQGRLIRARRQLSDGLTPVRLDDREAYVDQLILQFQLPVGHSILQIDDLEFGPIVRPETVVQASDQKTQMVSRLTIENDRIHKDGKPFFPLITLYHAEALDLIAQAGVNMLWIRNYDDRPLLTALEEMDIGAIASPPQPPPAEAILHRSALPSLPEWTSPIWAWMLGINLPAADRPFVTAWANQVRDADRLLHRPIIADVAEEIRDYHRHLDLLSISRTQMNSSYSSLDHFEELRGRRSHALPGKQLMTFVQTEASGPLLDYLGDRTNIPIVEPEQILHQGFEAIAAGFKGVGFWKQVPFDTDAPGFRERLDAIRIFSIHARLLEPYIATGRIVKDEVQVQVDPRRGALRPSSSPLSTRWDRPVDKQGKAGPAAGENPEIRATVFQTDHGLLILLVWHEPGAQCVPGPQTASNVRVLIGGIGDVVTACEVTPTSVGQSNLAMERISGGTELTLKSFDQYAAIIVTGNPEEAKEMQRLAWQTRQQAAESFVALAESKLARVREIQRQLEEVGSPPVLHAESILQSAAAALDEAKRNLSTGRADETRIASQRCMRLLRTLQRQHWNLAVASLTSPTTTMEATSFQTLPDHWKLMSRVDSRPNPAGNLLPTGTFDNEQALFSPASSTQELGWSTGNAESRYSSLRMVREESSANGYVSMIVKPDAPMGETATLISPPIHVNANDLIVITGQVHVRYPLGGPDHAFEIFDTIMGREGAIVYKEKTEGWTQFRLIRHAPAEGSVRIRFELKGPGIVDLDQIQVHSIPASEILRTSK